MEDDNVIPLERIRRYRVQMSRRSMARDVHKMARFCLEASTVLAVVGRGLQFMSRELGYDPYPSRHRGYDQPRRIRIPNDD